MKRWEMIAATLSLCCMAGCKDGQAAQQPHPAASAKTHHAAERLVKVDPSQVDSGRILLGPAAKKRPTDELLVTGQVVAPPHGKAEIGALLTARVRSVEVQEGTLVKKGQLLATLDAPDAARISGDLAAARARRARAETVLAQEQKLVEQRATSARSLSEATSDADTARADEVAATMMLSTYNVAGTRLSVRSPLAGVVATSHAMLGAQVDPGTMLFRIVDPAQLAVRADVPESMAGAIQLGAKAELWLSGEGLRCKAGVVASTRSVDPIKRTVSFRLAPEGACEGLLEGGFVDVQIALGSGPSTRPDAGSERELVAVPRSSVVELDGVPVVFLDGGQPGHYRMVTVGVTRHTETTTWVEHGLVGGERVVVKGALLLKGEWMRSRLE